mmetsp:Transcript_34747/g.38927  ORF Transcript_34747/g.38927 Transcript_34747/m.38927 type:complete len:102 (+) Transcript_34747:847-1152(+)
MGTPNASGNERTVLNTARRKLNDDDESSFTFLLLLFLSIVSSSLLLLLLLLLLYELMGYYFRALCSSIVDCRIRRRETNQKYPGHHLLLWQLRYHRSYHGE